MNKLQKITSIFVLISIAFLSACSDDESSSCENGTFQMNVNGSAVTATSFNNTLLKGANAGVDGKRMDIRATDGDGRELIITFTDLSSGSNGNCMTTTDTYVPFDEVSTGEENSFLFTFIEDDISYFITTGTLHITSCDETAKKVSGTFSFSTDEYVVTNGTFTDMCYAILQ